MKKRTLAAAALLGIVLAAGAMMFVPAAFAQEVDGEEVEATGGATTGDGLRVLGLGIGAGLAVGIAGFGTGTAQAGVGAGGTGAIAEKPELLINVLILFAIPETIVIFGMVIAFMLMGYI